MTANKRNILQSSQLRAHLAVFFVIAMLVGFFVSRAVLSLAMMGFGLTALVGVHPRRWLRERWWLLGLAWIGLYALSWFWSNDAGYWNTRLQVKLPVLLLPLAFAFTPAFSYLHQKIYTIVLCLLVLFAAGYSFYFFVQDPEHYIQGYIFSHVLPTIPKNDHIRTSLAVAAAVLWCVYWFPQIRERYLRWLVGVTVLVASIYLHVLAARTGLAAWYIFIVGYTVYLTVRKRTRWMGIGLIALFSVGTVAAFKYIPTLRERVGYFQYTLIVLEEQGLTGDYSDMGRFMSYDIAQKLIREHPWRGVGAGNILDTMKSGYDRWYPQVKDEQRLIPHNQFLTVGVACGLPCMLLFIAWVLYPVLKLPRNRSGFFFFILWCMMLVPLMVEPVLEIQFGVFVYLFFLLWQRHAMLKPLPAD